jgi:orotidine-5'-phosphate decarboxylase
MSDAALAICPVQQHAAIDVSECLIVALDFDNVDDANRTVDQLGNTVSFYKIGLQLQFAPKLRQFFKRLVAADKKIFLDFKYIDIPATIEGVVKSASELQIKVYYGHWAKAYCKSSD